MVRFLFVKTSKPALDSTHSIIHIIQDELLPGVKQADREADH